MGKGRAPCCDKSKVKKGPWSREEDIRLVTFINKYGHQNWRSLPKQAGLLRCGKSCRLRWINYLRPDVKRGNFTPQEEDTIIKLHQSFGNKWSKIASHLPGRTDNEIKNVWNTHLKKRLHGEAKLFDGSCANNSPSCSSSTSVLSHSDSANIEGEFKNVNANNMITEKQDATKSCSSASTLSNLSQVEISSDPYVNGTDVDDWIFNPEPNNLELRSKVHDDGVIEIPLECDADFWDILDIMDPLPPISESKQHDTSQSVCQVLSEFEHQKWFRYLENELDV